jgi:hypothetical protein
MTETSSRMDQFDAEIAAMRIRTGRSNRERLLLVGSVVLMVGGIALAFGAYVASLDVQATPGVNVDVLDSNSYVVLAVAGVAVSLVGGFGFLRYSLARFLRFWLLRQSYEQRRGVDQAGSSTGTA